MLQLTNGKAVLLAFWVRAVCGWGQVRLGLAALQRDAQCIVRWGRDLPAGMEAIPNRKHPKSTSFPPFYSLNQSPLSVQTLREVWDVEMPVQG